MRRSPCAAASVRILPASLTLYLPSLSLVVMCYCPFIANTYDQALALSSFRRSAVLIFEVTHLANSVTNANDPPGGQHIELMQVEPPGAVATR